MSTRDAITSAVHSQAAAWNEGDAEAFLATVSEDVVYVTSGGLVRGREGLREAYRRDWREKGGTLTAEVEEVMDHGDAATVIVHYWLAGSRDEHSGWSLLTFARIDGRWLIAADATLRRV